jgi:signal transduction histidine kinase
MQGGILLWPPPHMNMVYHSPTGEPMYNYRRPIAIISGILLTLGVGANALFGGYFAGEQARLPIGLLSAFLLLYLIQAWQSGCLRRFLPIYLAIQAAVVISLLLIPPLLDTFAVLFIAILLQVTPSLSTGDSFLLVGVFSAAASVTFFLDEGFPNALGQIFVYSAANILVTTFNLALSHLEQTRNQLQAYAAQAGELAKMKERNRLARELHDSVTQTIFGMTFTAETARAQLQRDPDQVSALLDKMQTLAEDALTEMRSLIFELRPTELETDGLVGALEGHIENLRHQGMLEVEFLSEGEERLSPIQTHQMFRITQEALNNVIKHAETQRARVHLVFRADQVLLTVTDRGKGFEPEKRSTGAHLGLKSLQERAASLDGQLQISAVPGEGTQIRVIVPTKRGGRYG